MLNQTPIRTECKTIRETKTFLNTLKDLFFFQTSVLFLFLKLMMCQEEMKNLELRCKNKTTQLLLMLPVVGMKRLHKKAKFSAEI